MLSNLYSKKKIQFFVFIVILIWCLGIFIDFFLNIIPNSVLFFPLLKSVYSLVCHMNPEKLFNIGEHSTIICSRCTGIYLGGLIVSFTTLLGLSKNISTGFLLMSSLPLFADVALSSLHIYIYSKNIAFVTGLLLGSVGFLYIHDLLFELFDQ